MTCWCFRFINWAKWIYIYIYISHIIEKYQEILHTCDLYTTTSPRMRDRIHHVLCSVPPNFLTFRCNSKWPIPVPEIILSMGSANERSHTQNDPWVPPILITSALSRGHPFTVGPCQMLNQCLLKINGTKGIYINHILDSRYIAEYTVKSRYNAVQYNMISHTVQQWLKQSIYPSYHSQS